VWLRACPCWRPVRSTLPVSEFGLHRIVRLQFLGDVQSSREAARGEVSAETHAIAARR
jgi:hypothetical protein